MRLQSEMSWSTMANSLATGKLILPSGARAGGRAGFLLVSGSSVANLPSQQTHLGTVPDRIGIPARLCPKKVSGTFRRSRFQRLLGWESSRHLFLGKAYPPVRFCHICMVRPSRVTDHSLVDQSKLKRSIAVLLVLERIRQIF